jgi:hypothetical protein
MEDQVDMLSPQREATGLIEQAAAKPGSQWR